MQENMIADIDFYNYLSFIFKMKSHFHWKKKHNTPEKVAIDEEEQMVMI